MRKSITIGLAVLVAASLVYFAGHKTLTSLAPATTTNGSLGKSITNLKWTTCEGTGNRYVTVNSVTIEGDITKGSWVTLTVYGVVNQPFTHAATWADCKYGFLNIWTGTEEEVPPVSYDIGPTAVTKQDKIWQDLPSGSYTVVMKMLDPQGNMLQCVQASYKIVS